MLKAKCFSKQYKTPVFANGAIVCWGGFGSQPCEHLRKCISQFENLVTSRALNAMLKRADNIIKNELWKK